MFQFLFNASLQIQLLMIINLQPIKRKRKTLHVKNRTLSLNFEDALTAFEAGVLLRALLSYFTISKDFSSYKRKAAAWGPWGFLFVWGGFGFFPFNSLKAEWILLCEWNQSDTREPVFRADVPLRLHSH